MSQMAKAIGKFRTFLLATHMLDPYPSGRGSLGSFREWTVKNQQKTLQLERPPSIIVISAPMLALPAQKGRPGQLRSRLPPQGCEIPFLVSRHSPRLTPLACCGVFALVLSVMRVAYLYACVHARAFCWYVFLAFFGLSTSSCFIESCFIVFCPCELSGLLSPTHPCRVFAVY